MSTNAVREQISELRWLVDQLEQERATLATTPYPLVHQFLMRNLATRIASVAVQVHGVLSEPAPDTSVLSEGVRFVEQSA
jgi:hypothetical protein